MAVCKQQVGEGTNRREFGKTCRAIVDEFDNMPLKGEGTFFWSVEGAWGEATVGQDGLCLTVIEGTLALKRLAMSGADGVAAVSLNGEAVRFSVEGGDIAFDGAVTVRAGDTLTAKR